MRGSWLAGIVVSLISTLAFADQRGSGAGSPPSEDPSGMEVIVVTGLQPGPGLWKVSRRNHVMWILGEVSPYPRATQLNSAKFDRLLRSSQELIVDFSGFWRLTPSTSAAYERAKNLPEGSVLKDVIS